MALRVATQVGLRRIVPMLNLIPAVFTSVFRCGAVVQAPVLEAPSPGGCTKNTAMDVADVR